MEPWETAEYFGAPEEMLRVRQHYFRVANENRIRVMVIEDGFGFQPGQCSKVWEQAAHSKWSKQLNIYISLSPSINIFSFPSIATEKKESFPLQYRRVY